MKGLGSCCISGFSSPCLSLWLHNLNCSWGFWCFPLSILHPLVLALGLGVTPISIFTLRCPSVGALQGTELNVATQEEEEA